MRTIRENPGTLLIALIVAVILKSYVWYIDPPTSLEINIPIELKNVPAGLSVSSMVPNRAELEIRGQKSKVEKYRERDFYAIADCSEIEGAGQHKVELRLSQSRFQGLSWYMVPETVHLIIGQSETKFFRPELSIIDDFRENRTISSIEGLPETISVSGSISLLSVVNEVIYELSVDNPNDTWTTEVNFKPVDSEGKVLSNLVLDPEKATIRVHLSKQTIEQEIPVLLRLSGTPASDYTVTSQKVTPTRIKVNGDPSTISGLTNIETEIVSLNNLKSSFSRDVQLVIPSPDVVLEPEKVQVRIEIAQLDTQREISGIPITLRRQREGFNYVLEPPVIDVRLRGPIDSLKNLDINLVKATIFVGDYTEGNHEITLNPPGLPAGIILLEMNPKKVMLKVNRTQDGQGEPSSDENNETE